MQEIVRFRWRGLLAGLLLTQLTACSNDAAPNSGPAIQAAATAEVTSAANQPADTRGGVKAPETAIDVKVVKYDGLGQTIKGLKGKIVVVDFWSLT